ncbi:TIGR03936 family radical SAM-associated protein [Oceanotoga sp. DSM 15011]|uniref:TIGR03936 family radical SAM-associated protein n=1 Tax=Oceanotoga sp. DSM 15011 TaxID=2984951 RepID=UPI0021F3D0FF|nr:TIGR03936 family radical SAM-associated protein [Oceanotoga sp. DSM 15011]UYO99830.1 TIGR03936 family radical SAM-associated protein [Oceanotoga sp. DSM 15011]
MKYMLKLKKYGNLAFTSHRDFISIIEYTLRRAKCPLEFSKGFSPKPIFSYTSALPLGYINRELYIIVNTKKSFNFEILNSCSPKGLKLIEFQEKNDDFNINEEIDKFKFRIYISKNIYENFKNMDLIQKGQNFYNKNEIFEDLKCYNNNNKIYILEFFQNTKNIFNFYKIINKMNLKNFIYYPYCIETVWRG